jgi:enamine deaminase RidA (YjgF/YER057c/UK114 family)
MSPAGPPPAMQHFTENFCSDIDLFGAAFGVKVPLAAPKSLNYGAQQADRGGGIMADVKISNPGTLPKPAGAYSHIAEIEGARRLVVVAGQVALAPDGKVIAPHDVEKQTAEVYANIGRALKAAGGDWRNVIQMMTFLVRREDIAKFFAARTREFPKLFPDGKYPPNTLLVVSGLVSEEIAIEIQAIAAI